MQTLRHDHDDLSLEAKERKRKLAVSVEDWERKGEVREVYILQWWNGEGLKSEVK